MSTTYALFMDQTEVSIHIDSAANTSQVLHQFKAGKFKNNLTGVVLLLKHPLSLGLVHFMHAAYSYKNATNHKGSHVILVATILWISSKAMFVQN